METHLQSPFFIDDKEKPGKIKEHINKITASESNREVLIELDYSL